MVRCTMGIARIASLPPWTRSKAVGKALLYCLTSDAFVGLDHELACIWTMCVMMVLKLYYFCYYIWTWVVITHFVLRCMLNYSWTFVSCGLYVESCTILVVCWQLFEIHRDTRWTTEFIWAQVWQCDRFGGCHCTCALINWSILPHPSTKNRGAVHRPRIGGAPPMSFPPL